MENYLFNPFSGFCDDAENVIRLMPNCSGKKRFNEKLDTTLMKEENNLLAAPSESSNPFGHLSSEDDAYTRASEVTTPIAMVTMDCDAEYWSPWFNVSHPG